jgi:DNA-binding transcriptional LysR family regulator
MELRHLRYLVAVATEMSFTRAASRLRLSQSSLTRQIKNLEQELRVRLFSRDKRSITLTEQGEFFLKRTKKLLSQAALNIQDVRRREPSRGKSTLNIGYAADLHYNLLPGALGILRKIWPDVALNLFDLTVAEQLRAFEQDRLDVSFVREVVLPVKAGLQREHIHDCEVMAVLPEAYPEARASATGLVALKSMPFVTLSEKLYPGHRAWLKRVCELGGFAPKIAQAADRVPTLLTCVGLELGVALLPQSCQQLPHAGAVFRPLKEEVKSRTEILWKRPSLSQPLQQYIKLIRGRLQVRLAGEHADHG